MPGLLDIGPLSETVTLRGSEIKLQGIGADALVNLLDRFPDLYKAIGQRADLDASTFVKLGPDIVANVIATAAGEGDNPKAVEMVKSLTIGEMMELLDPVLRMTFPRGFGPFVVALSELVERAGSAVDQSGKDQGTKSA
jgi:hypothetical protein